MAASQEKRLCDGTFDLQINGAFGVDFSSCDLTLEELERCCERLRNEGVAGILATFITDRLENLEAAISRLIGYREQSRAIQGILRGFHIEGPFLSSKTGFVGAHDPQRTMDATRGAAERLYDAAQGLLRIWTVAPERDARGEVTAWLAQHGVRVAIGHSDASLAEIRVAIDAGASLVTHYGNGCPQLLGRHDNVLQRLLNQSDRLMFGVIADGVHLPKFFLENLLKILGPKKMFVVSDAIHAAGCGPGLYRLSGQEIRVGEDGIPRTPDLQYLAGSGWTQRRMDVWMAEELEWSFDLRRELLVDNPRQIIDR
ncbi:MAG: N-acetylglucosamine-6-phosphate deacetylase [Planctomycetota bacterium]|jgi:N-acetylglucosamine-6-phosphate deacetylase